MFDAKPFLDILPGDYRSEFQERAREAENAGMPRIKAEAVALMTIVMQIKNWTPGEEGEVAEIATRLAQKEIFWRIMDALRQDGQL